MPRPPLLPLIDWPAVFASGKEYAAWLSGGENVENQQRMEALRAEQTLDDRAVAFLSALARPVHVVAIAESWCGNVVRHVPVLQRLADACPRLRVRYIAREDYLDVFARFLTNGGEAIPKFVFLSEDFVECGHWGPMPDECRRFIAWGKACGDVGAARKLVAAAYEVDAGKQVVVNELVWLLDIASSATPDAVD